MSRGLPKPLMRAGGSGWSPPGLVSVLLSVSNGLDFLPLRGWGV